MALLCQQRWWAQMEALKLSRTWERARLFAISQAICRLNSSSPYQDAYRPDLRKKRGSKPASALTGENTKLRCTVMLCAMAEGAKLRQYVTFKCKELTSTPLFPGIIVRANNSRINSDASNPGKKTRCLFGLPVNVGAGAWTHCKASQPTR